jgi:hypothetical protein
MPDSIYEPVPYHKWDFFIGRATVDGTLSVHDDSSPFIANLLSRMKELHATQVWIGFNRVTTC